MRNAYRIHKVLAGPALVLDDGLELRQVVLDLEDLLELGVVLHHDHVALGALRDRPTRLGGVRRVDAGGETAAKETRRQLQILTPQTEANQVIYHGNNRQEGHGGRRP